MCNNYNRNWLMVMGVLVVLALVVSICAHWLPRFPGDLRLALLLQSVYSEPLHSVMDWVSFLSDEWRAAILIAIGGIVVWRFLGRLEGVLVVVAGLSSLVNFAFKVAVNRPRPTPDLVQVFGTEQGSSFPSGHAFFAAVFLGVLAYFAFTFISKRSIRMLCLASLLILILLIGASRVFLGIHWPSDVLGGYLVGTLFLAAFIWIYRTWKHYFKSIFSR
ncbi:phosphatase PAP2 family protein [Chloroflexota bacterium]